MKKIVRFTILAVLMAVAGGASANLAPGFDGGGGGTCNPFTSPTCLPPQ